MVRLFAEYIVFVDSSVLLNEVFIWNVASCQQACNSLQILGLMPISWLFHPEEKCLQIFYKAYTLGDGILYKHTRGINLLNMKLRKIMSAT